MPKRGGGIGIIVVEINLSQNGSPTGYDVGSFVVKYDRISSIPDFIYNINTSHFNCETTLWRRGFRKKMPKVVDNNLNRHINDSTKPRPNHGGKGASEENVLSVFHMTVTEGALRNHRKNPLTQLIIGRDFLVQQSLDQ